MAKKDYKIHPERLEWFERQFNFTFHGIPENSEILINSILAEISQKNQTLIELKVMERTGASNAMVKDPKELYRFTYAQEGIKQETKEYIEYLEYRLSQIAPIKSTAHKEVKERYAIMEILDFFSSKKWNGLISEKERNTLLAEILQCDIDTAKKIRSPKSPAKYHLKEEKRMDLEDRINSMQKKGL